MSGVALSRVKHLRERRPDRVAFAIDEAIGDDDRVARHLVHRDDRSDDQGVRLSLVPIEEVIGDALVAEASRRFAVVAREGVAALRVVAHGVGIGARVRVQQIRPIERAVEVGVELG